MFNFFYYFFIRSRVDHFLKYFVCKDKFVNTYLKSKPNVEFSDELFNKYYNKFVVSKSSYSTIWKKVLSENYNDIYDSFSQENKKKFREIVDDFLLFIKDNKLIIHNADFDVAHLNNELELLGKTKIDKSNVIDTLEIARNKFPGSQISLDALCKRYRIDNSGRIKHTALVDCELLTKVYINLIDQKEPKLNFIPDNQITREEKLINKKDYFKKIVKPSPEEIKSHKEFLKNNLKKNFY